MNTRSTVTAICVLQGITDADPRKTLVGGARCQRDQVLPADRNLHHAGAADRQLRQGPRHRQGVVQGAALVAEELRPLAAGWRRRRNLRAAGRLPQLRLWRLAGEIHVEPASRARGRGVCARRRGRGRPSRPARRRCWISAATTTSRTRTIRFFSATDTALPARARITSIWGCIGPGARTKPRAARSQARCLPDLPWGRAGCLEGRLPPRERENARRGRSGTDRARCSRRICAPIGNLPRAGNQLRSDTRQPG